MSSAVRDNENMAFLLDRRTLNLEKDFLRKSQFHLSFVKRLSKVSEFVGHRGCVNTIAWNETGSLLLSGSDDQQAKIWDFAARKCTQSVDTGHSANIFSAIFLPQRNDEVVVTGAGDGEVRVHKRSLPENIDTYLCHGSRRVKKLDVSNQPYTSCSFKIAALASKSNGSFWCTGMCLGLHDILRTLAVMEFVVSVIQHEPGNPNLFWSGGEDGTIRQFDLREPHHCSDEFCRNILLNLRRSGKNNLGEGPKRLFEIKSFMVNPVFPNQILVGGSDAFARLFDRRMLRQPSGLGADENSSASPCVCYYAPFHLSKNSLESINTFVSPVSLTHVAFSPEGGQVLLSYSGEHVYLMDSFARSSEVSRFTVEDMRHRYDFKPAAVGREGGSSGYAAFVEGSCAQGWVREDVRSAAELCEALLSQARAALHQRSKREVLLAVDLCSSVLDRQGLRRFAGRAVRRELLCVRAESLMQLCRLRCWRADSDMAMRDCLAAMEVDRHALGPYVLMAKCLEKKHKLSQAWLYLQHCLEMNPGNTKLQAWCADLAAKIERQESGGRPVESPFRPPAQSSPLSEPSSNLSIRDILQAEEDQLRLAREAGSSDWDNSGSEYSDSEDEMLGSASKPGMSAEHTAVCVDMRKRYTGHCNTGTDIKQASFLGQQGEFIASGSDDGRWFIWEKSTGRLVRVLQGDENVVNCIQSHPYDCAVATSGIDDTIKVWSPLDETPSLLSEASQPVDVVDVMDSNFRHMCDEIGDFRNPVDIIHRFRVETGAGQQIQCQQS